jgi:hypothetical protein
LVSMNNLSSCPICLLSCFAVSFSMLVLFYLSRFCCAHLEAAR